MNVEPLPAADRQVIDSYGPGRFRVSGRTWEGSILVFPERTMAWPVRDAAALSAEALASVREAQPPVEVLLVGCGRGGALLPAALRQELRAAGIGVDAMDTGAACRTYNLLLGEERRVAAALIALP